MSNHNRLIHKDSTLSKAIIEQIEIELKKTNEKQCDGYMRLIIDADKIENAYYRCQTIEKIISSFSDDIRLKDSQAQYLLIDCKYLSTLAQLYQIQNANINKKKRDLREKIRVVSGQQELHQIFMIPELLQLSALKATKQYRLVSEVVKRVVDMLLDFGEDFYHYLSIFDVMLKALCLTSNNQQIGTDNLLIQVADKLITKLQNQTELFQWQVLLETILNCTQYNERSDELIQPNLVGRLLLAKIPCLEQLLEHLGVYLSLTSTINCATFESLLRFKPTPQALQLIHCLCKQIIIKSLKGDVNCTETITIVRQVFLNTLLQNIKNTFCIQPTLDIINLLIRTFPEEVILNNVVNALIGQLQTRNSADKEQIKKTLGLIKNAYPKQTSQTLQGYQNNAYSECSWEGLLQQDKRKQQQMIGIKNIFNNCYINSFIQVLMMTQQFRELVLSQQLGNSVNSFKQLPTLGEVLQKCFAYLMSMKTEVDYCPFQLKRALREPYCSEWTQQDAGEFGQHLFDDFEQKFKPEEYAQIKKMFAGKYKSAFKCQLCKKESLGPDEEFLQINLNFTAQENSRYSSVALTVPSLLDKYLSQESIEYTCDHCKKNNINTRQLTLQVLPLYLIILLNRFKFTNGFRQKVKDKVLLESELRIQIKDSNTSTRYQLYAFIMHYGSTSDAGHYVTYALKDNKWYKFDDSIVTQEYDTVERLSAYFSSDRTPYILFYRMISQQ